MHRKGHRTDLWLDLHVNRTLVYPYERRILLVGFFGLLDFALVKMFMVSKQYEIMRQLTVVALQVISSETHSL
jgi:hypothetical protein